jgi:NAD(P)-dependent dehydrogenase (short-subunit alcohol dehydrogenase family)
MPDRPDRELAIVTGAAAGIGRAAACRLAAGGYRVACLDIDEDGAVAFLCSADALYVTGAMLFVDGGMLLTAHT